MASMVRGSIELNRSCTDDDNSSTNPRLLLDPVESNDLTTTGVHDDDDVDIDGGGAMTDLYLPCIMSNVPDKTDGTTTCDLLVEVGDTGGLAVVVLLPSPHGSVTEVIQCADFDSCDSQSPPLPLPPQASSLELPPPPTPLDDDLLAWLLDSPPNRSSSMIVLMEDAFFHGKDVATVGGVDADADATRGMRKGFLPLGVGSLLVVDRLDADEE